MRTMGTRALRFPEMNALLLACMWAFFVPGPVLSVSVSGPDVCHIRWLTPLEHDFGTIEQGKPVVVTFRFRNEGTAPVLLQTARTTCGCTAPTWTEQPVAPGEEGTLTVEYDAYKNGPFRKKIAVFFDCRKKSYPLYILGKVKKKQTAHIEKDKF